MAGFKYGIIWALTIMLIVTGCEPAGSPVPLIQIESEEVAENKSEHDSEAVLEVWSYFDISWLKDAFKEKYPSAGIKVKLFDYDKFADAYIEALANGTAPDVMVIDNGKSGYFNTIDGLENLLNPPYNGQTYFDAIPDHLRGLYRSFRGSRFIAMPIQLTAAVTLYRADIMEQYGIPSEPDEFSTYIKDADNLLKLAETLKKDDKYIFQNALDPIYIVSYEGNMFNEELEFVRTTPAYREGIELARKIQRSGLSLEHSIWSEQGQAAVRDGRLSMLYLGQWGINTLQGWVPEMEGNWRIAQLPLGIYGFVGGSSVAISSTSEHKELAWEIVELMTDPGLGIAENLYSPFLGNQNIGRIVTESIRKMNAQFPTPFDHVLGKLWEESVQSLVWSEASIDKEFTRLEEEVERIVGDKREYLQEYVK